jgi:hypothetical protein
MTTLAARANAARHTASRLMRGIGHGPASIAERSSAH